MATLKHPITPSLWLNGDVKKAAKFYVSVFPNSKILGTSTIHDTPDGDCDVVQFKLFGQPFWAFGPNKHFKFNESLSLMVLCDTQKEIDYYWKKLSAQPKFEQCGWLKDKFGVSWQVTPSFMSKVMSEGTPAQIGRVMRVFGTMKKIDLAKIKESFKK